MKGRAGPGSFGRQARRLRSSEEVEPRARLQGGTCSAARGERLKARRQGLVGGAVGGRPRGSCSKATRPHSPADQRRSRHPRRSAGHTMATFTLGGAATRRAPREGTRPLGRAHDAAQLAADFPRWHCCGAPTIPAALTAGAGAGADEALRGCSDQHHRAPRPFDQRVRDTRFRGRGGPCH